MIVEQQKLISQWSEKETDTVKLWVESIWFMTHLLWFMIQFHTRNSGSIQLFKPTHSDERCSFVRLPILVNTKSSVCEKSEVRSTSHSRRSNECLPGFLSEVLHPEPCSSGASTASVVTVKCVAFQKRLIFIKCVYTDNNLFILRCCLWKPQAFLSHL